MLTAFLFILSILAQQGGSFKNELETYLKKNLPGYEDYKYEILQTPRSYKKMEIISKDDFNMSGNMIYLPVRLTGKDGRISKSILSIRLKLYKMVYVAVKTIKKDENLTAPDFALKKYDVANLNSKPVTSLKELDLYRSANFLNPGDALTKEDLELKPVILAGNPVDAEYKYGSVYISFEAISRQDGVPGEMITIITKDKKLYKAKVINSHDVNIIE